jgi:predicted phage baseplate assembly protein
MPLADNLPQLDTRRYDDIVTEVKARIARYTPEWKPLWTDFNDSDPGITLVQVFAWLTDMMLYRIGRVPELNYLKFLQLLNIELKPAEPATAEISFPVKVQPPATEPFIDVPLHTQVAATGEDGAPVVFETDRAIHALTAVLDDMVLTYDGFEFKPVQLVNGRSAQGFEPFGHAPGPEHALFLGFMYPPQPGVTPPPFPAGELDLALWACGTDAPASFSCALSRSTHPSADIAWEYWTGGGWRTLSLLKDETQALTRSGHVRFRLPAAGTLALGLFGPGATVAHYWIRARVERAAYERPPCLLAIRTNTVSATQAETVQDEVLGGSDGSRNQRVTLAHAPVLHDTLRLEIDEGSGFAEWTRVDDFYASGPNDLHYLLDRTTGEIVLGDGLNGHAPAANADLPGENIVAREYRFGGGARGNVPTGAISNLLTTIQGIDDQGVANLFAAVGGREEETLEEAKVRAPRTIKSRCRAVTAEDFEELAKAAANIRRAKALPLWHPGFPGVPVAGVVSVIVVPDAETARDKRVPNPMPSEGTLRNVCEYLNQARLITTELFVLPPTYRLVSVHAEVIAESNADLAELKTSIEEALGDYFHPLVGGEDGQGWPFGGDIYFSRVFQRISVPGVRRVDRVVISLDGREMPQCQNIPICDGILVYSTEHDVIVNYGSEE